VARRMTLRRQLLAGYLVPLLATLALVAVAVAALVAVIDRKREVIGVDVAQEVDAHRLIAEVNARATNSRGFLITRDPSLLAAQAGNDERIEELFVAIEDRITTDDGRRLMAQARTARETWVQTTVDVQQRVFDDAPREEIAELFATRLAPDAEALRSLLRQIAERYDDRVAEAVRASDEQADTATRTVWGLGLLAVLASLGTALWFARRITRQLTELALTVDAAASEVLAGTTQQVAGSAQQAAAVQETVSTVEELVQTAQQSAERARAVAEQAQRAADASHDGTRAVEESAAGMVGIRDQVDATARTVVELAERAQAISDIVAAVEEIAGQTHLLALNAAIEAARAGEHGKGFSVVAREVRSLAGQSRRATSQVSQILGEIQQGTTTAVMASEEGTKRVADGVSRTQQAGETIRELADNVASAAEAGEQIAASSTQQAVVTGQIGEAMRNIEQVMDQNRASAREAEQAARDLHRVAAELKDLVGATRNGR
jgi:methyl-accepting chemotaxis protein